MPFRKIFLSRWSALLWAAGILWTAVDVAGVAPSTTTTDTAVANETDATGVEVNGADLTLLANVMKGD
ncbi:hypothetical protein AB5I39_14615 [Sphingomonas sp. MMS24-J45]|uniref:hypothetical protein n=1 Tax=Sphingomonas sp. MMS24-J45 TaxID=3238806 RepID=UPI00384B0D19